VQSSLLESRLNAKSAKVAVDSRLLKTLVFATRTPCAEYLGVFVRLLDNPNTQFLHCSTFQCNYHHYTINYTHINTLTLIFVGLSLQIFESCHLLLSESLPSVWCNALPSPCERLVTCEIVQHELLIYNKHTCSRFLKDNVLFTFYQQIHYRQITIKTLRRLKERC
jgi:hypothetical protein